MKHGPQRPIGGFFELEVPHTGSQPHPNAVALSTGRSCTLVILEQLKPRLVHVPFHSCAASLAPFEKANVPFRFYGLNEDLSPNDLPELGADEYILWINYYGLCDRITDGLKARFGNRLIIDDTHAFFNEGHDGPWSFTSARKYFGVPDGAYLYGPKNFTIRPPRFARVSVEHSVLRAVGRQAEAFRAYQAYEASMPCDVYSISVVSEGLLRSIDFPLVAEIRRRNYNFFQDQLGSLNTLPLRSLGENVPFCYPYLPEQSIDRKELSDKGLFVPTLWPDAAQRGIDGFEWDKRLSKDVLPLPIDHRYTTEDLQRLSDHLLNVR